MKRFLEVVRSIGLLVARVALAVVLISHGWARWTGPGLGAQVTVLEAAAIPQPVLVAWGAMLLEVVGGVLLVFGAFTPAIALFVLVEQVIVIAWVKWPHGLALDSGGFEYNLILAALALIFLVYGAGKASVDSLFLRPASEKRSSSGVNDADPA